jgi:hypothetical protein
MFNNQADLFDLGIAIHQQPGKEKSQFDFFHIKGIVKHYLCRLILFLQIRGSVLSRKISKTNKSDMLTVYGVKR